MTSLLSFLATVWAWLDGWKAYISAVASLGGALYFGLVEKDYSRAWELFVGALAVFGLRHSDAKVEQKLDKVTAQVKETKTELRNMNQAIEESSNEPNESST